MKETKMSLKKWYSKVTLRYLLATILAAGLIVYSYIIVKRVSYSRRMACEHAKAEAFWKEAYAVYGGPLRDEWDEKYFFKRDKELRDSVIRAENEQLLIRGFIEFHSKSRELFERAASNPLIYSPPRLSPPPYEDELASELLGVEQ